MRAVCTNKLTRTSSIRPHAVPASAVRRSSVVVGFALEHTSCQLAPIAPSDADTTKTLVRLGAGGAVDRYSLTPT